MPSSGSLFRFNSSSLSFYSRSLRIFSRSSVILVISSALKRSRATRLLRSISSRAFYISPYSTCAYSCWKECRFISSRSLSAIVFYYYLNRLIRSFLTYKVYSSASIERSLALNLSRLISLNRWLSSTNCFFRVTTSNLANAVGSGLEYIPIDLVGLLGGLFCCW